MSVKARITLCFLSVFVASTFVGLSGVWHLAAKQLHGTWVSVLAIFIVLYLASMFFIMRGRIAKSYWSILITTALAYPAASFAYIIYFSTFDSERFINTLKHTEFLAFGSIAFVLVPTISFAWLFGALAGFAFLMLSRVPRLNQL